MRTGRAMTCGCVAILAAIFAGTQLQAQKGKPAATNPHWVCSVNFRDAAGDVIRSDGRGTYSHGTDQKVTCEIYTEGAGVPPGKLHFQPQSKSTRRVVIVGQEGYSGAQTRQPDYFEVLDLKSATDTTATYLRPFRVTKEGTDVFRGNSFVTPDNPDPWYADPYGVYTGSSSVFVKPLSNCAWDIWFDPGAAAPLQVDATGKVVESDGTVENLLHPNGPRLLALYTQTRSGPANRGYFPMPFSARVTVISGGASCTP